MHHCLLLAFIYRQKMSILEILAIVVTPITEIGKAFVVTVTRQVNYVVRCRQNVDNLRNEVHNLDRKKNDIEGLVNAARRNGEVITDTAQHWLDEVSRVEEEAKKLHDRLNESRTCFDLKSRYKIGKGAETVMTSVNQLQTIGNSCTISYPRPTPTVESLITRDYVAFESTERYVNQVIDGLKDEKINIIGVWGMGGVGKTTLIKKVAKHVKEEKLFGEVVLLTLSEKPDIKKIQGEIADQLGMRLHSESEMVRAWRMIERVKEEKSILIILDNLWETLDLVDAGIPYGDNRFKVIKIILTTRSRDICSAMDCQLEIGMKTLSEQDAWCLFKEKAGVTNDSPRLVDIAQEVFKECGGLPLAVVTLARALRGKQEFVWRDVLLQLKRSNPSNIMGMNGKVFASIELSYNYLESEEAKLCFLFCLLTPDGNSISPMNFAAYGMGEGLFNDIVTLNEALDRTKTLLCKLKDSSLLIEGDENWKVKMHDVVRDVAISIASRDANGFFIKAGLGLKEWPEKENLERCKRIILCDNQIEKLPDVIECPHLLTLSLDNNPSLHNIPDSFFEGMKGLRVLDLCETKIPTLPSSLQYLTNLRTLWLARCPQLKDVTLIGKLKKLELLYLNKSGICELPIEFGGLTNLRILDLSKNTQLEVVAPNVISRLTRLEELNMGLSFSKWEVKGSGNVNQANFSEIQALTRLTSLDVHVENDELLSQEILGPWTNLTKFWICVGKHIHELRWRRRGMTIGNISYPVPNWVKVLLERTEELELVNNERLRNFYELQEIDFNGLLCLRFFNCGEMECVFGVREASLNAFKNLEVLELVGLVKLEKIFQSPQPSGFFGNLELLIVYGCNKITVAFPSDVLKWLQNLVKIQIGHCHGLREIFNSEGVTEGDVVLPRLKDLILDELPSLTYIWKGEVPDGSLQSLEKLFVDDCQNLSYVFSPTFAARTQQLKFLRVEDCTKVVNLIDANETRAFGSLPEKYFQSLERIEITRCHGFRSILSLNLARDLKNLEILLMGNNDGMEMIIAEETGELMDNCVLPQLNFLGISTLPRLTSLNQKGLILSWPSLANVAVANSPNMKRLCLGPQNAPKISKLVGSKEWVEALEEWNDERTREDFLKKYHVCPADWVE